MDTRDNTRVVLSFFDHLSKGDAGAALALMDEEATWWVAGRTEQFPLAGTYAKHEFTAMLGRIGQAMPDGVDVVITSTTAQDDRVVIEAETHGLSATGRRYDNRLIYAIELREGRILRAREYLDTIHANDVLVDG